MDDTHGSLFSIEDIEHAELEQAALVPFADNITTCSCRGMCLREKGRNACPCRTISQSCSTACHPGRSACMNKKNILGGNSSEDSESEETDKSASAISDNEEQPEWDRESQKTRTRGVRQGRSRASVRRERGGQRGRGSYRDRIRSPGEDESTQGRVRRSTRRAMGRGRGRLVAEVNSEQRVADHEQQLQRMVQNLNLEVLQVLALELLRRQPAVFADLVNGDLLNNEENQVLPEEGDLGQEDPAALEPGQGEPGQEDPGQEDPGPGQVAPAWCMCGMCRQMPIQVENKCCCTRKMECITAHPLFQQLVLDGNVLDIAMRYREDVLVLEHPRNNENFRHAAYRQYILWQHGRLGQGNRRVVPSCCVSAIRARYPSPNGIYTGFRPARLP